MNNFHYFILITNFNNGYIYYYLFGLEFIINLLKIIINIIILFSIVSYD